MVGPNIRGTLLSACCIVYKNVYFRAPAGVLMTVYIYRTVVKEKASI